MQALDSIGGEPLEGSGFSTRIRTVKAVGVLSARLRLLRPDCAETAGKRQPNGDDEHGGGERDPSVHGRFIERLNGDPGSD